MYSKLNYFQCISHSIVERNLKMSLTIWVTGTQMLLRSLHLGLRGRRTSLQPIQVGRLEQSSHKAESQIAEFLSSDIHRWNYMMSGIFFKITHGWGERIGTTDETRLWVNNCWSWVTATLGVCYIILFIFVCLKLSKTKYFLWAIGLKGKP